MTGKTPPNQTPSNTADGAQVTAHEHGLVRVFAIGYDLEMDIKHSGTYDRLCRALGIDDIDGDHIQQLAPHVLDATNLHDFLAEGYDIAADDLQDNAFALDAAEEAQAMLLLIRSPAFTTRPVALKTDGDASLIATLREPGANVVFEPLPNPDPEAVLHDPPQKKRPSDAAMSGRIAMVALLVMALLVWLMIWVAG